MSLFHRFDVTTLDVQQLMNLDSTPRPHVANCRILRHFTRKDSNETHLRNKRIDPRLEDLSNKGSVFGRAHFNVLTRFSRRMSDKFTRCKSEIRHGIHQLFDTNSRLRAQADNRNQRARTDGLINPAQNFVGSQLFSIQIPFHQFIVGLGNDVHHR